MSEPRMLIPSDTPPSLSERIWSALVRTAVWVILMAVLYFLRSFFLLIFLTFVFAYIQANGVRRLEGRIRNRPARVTLVFLGLLMLLIAIGSFLIPRVRKEAALFVERIPTYIQATDSEIVSLSASYPIVGELIPGIDQISAPTGVHERGSLISKKSPTGFLLHRFVSFGEDDESGTTLKQSVDTAKNVGAYLAAIGSAFFLSLLFSFLIVLDLPALASGAQNLRHSKLAFVYEEVAPSIHAFGGVLGRAIEAQLLIAILNTVLTAAGLFLLGIGEKVAFLSVIVFACSFIPVAGVFISSIPICLIALQEGGLWLAVFAVILITVTHMVEAYILNPRIYGHHLRMNPVVVLIILTIAGKMFGVWGLVLGVPICTYIFGHAIRAPEPGVGDESGDPRSISV